VTVIKQVSQPEQTIEPIAVRPDEVEVDVRSAADAAVPHQPLINVDPSLAATFAELAAGGRAADAIIRAVSARTDRVTHRRVSLAELNSYLMARDFWLSEADSALLFASLANDDGFITRDSLRNALNSWRSCKPPYTSKPVWLWLMALRPPPCGVGVFGDLVQPGGAVDVPKTEERAISLRQLKAVVKHSQRRCEAEGWIGKRFSGGRMHYELIAPQAVNLYDVATHVILPATYGHMLPDGQTKPSYVQLVADRAQPPDYFASHFWAEPVQDFLACIAQH